jgi:hypothetical protein
MEEREAQLVVIGGYKLILEDGPEISGSSEGSGDAESTRRVSQRNRREGHEAKTQSNGSFGESEITKVHSGASTETSTCPRDFSRKGYHSQESQNPPENLSKSLLGCQH